MRTTLTIEPAVAERLRKLLLDDTRTFKGLVNEALREGLRVMESSQRKKPHRFRVETHNFGGLNPGIDPSRIGQYADDLEDESIITRLRRQ